MALTIPELEVKLAKAIEVYNRTPARDWAASLKAKRNVTLYRNKIRKIEQERLCAEIVKARAASEDARKDELVHKAASLVLLNPDMTPRQALDAAGRDPYRDHGYSVLVPMVTAVTDAFRGIGS